VSYLLDTDTFNHFHRGHQKVSVKVAAAGVDNVRITIVTRIEILQGRFDFILKSADRQQLETAQLWLTRSETALAMWQEASLDAAACQEFDSLRVHRPLRKIGRRDLLIACIALANQATLVTRNLRDFSLVPRLRFENWVD
jgi:tRNA(fMet)-specific endonuclease VapC